jgi:hypothetical protein
VVVEDTLDMEVDGEAKWGGKGAAMEMVSLLIRLWARGLGTPPLREAEATGGMAGPEDEGRGVPCDGLVFPVTFANYKKSTTKNYR